MKVNEIMTAEEIKYCSPETKLFEAVKLMKHANCGALPVLDSHNRVIGIITDRDIALSISEKDASKNTIGEIMTIDPHTVNLESDIWVALNEMRINKIGRLPVVDGNGKLKGIISMHNLLLHHFEGEIELGKVSDKGENLIKTLKAIDSRYNKKEKVL